MPYLTPQQLELKRHRDRQWSRARRKRAKQENPEALRLKDRAKTLRSYGLTLEGFNLLSMAQSDVCAICLQPETTHPRLNIDHNHERGKKAVRGLLCNRCNRGLGFLGDDLERLRRAVAYLEGYALGQERLDAWYQSHPTITACSG